MTINGYRFLFAGHDSEEFGVILCSIGSPNTETNDEETNIRMTKNAFKETWDFHGLEYTTPLQFKITICKSNGEFINSNEQAELKKWLCKSKRYWLQIEQDDLVDTFYNVLITNPRPVSIGAMNGGLEFSVTCDCGHAWSGLNRKTYSTVNGTLTFKFNNTTQYDDYILYPTLIITPTINGNISIKNDTTNQTVTINNCVTTEVITMDGKNDMLESSNGRVLLDNWDKEFLEILPENNIITLTGDFNLTIEYRLPKRVGG